MIRVPKRNPQIKINVNQKSYEILILIANAFQRKDHHKLNSEQDCHRIKQKSHLALYYQFFKKEIITS